MEERKMEIPEFAEIMNEIKELRSELTAILEKTNTAELSQEWYNDEQCWRLKGGMALNTFRNNRYYQVKGGVPDAKVGGRKVWSRESVIEWLKLTDDQMAAYHKKYMTGAKKNGM